MKKQQGGFSVIEIILLLVLLALVGAIGWYVWSQNQSPQPASNNQQQSNQSQNNSQQQAAAVTVDNGHFTLELPTGFAESAERIFTYTGAPGKTYTYKNATTGDYFELNFDPAATGYNPDFTWYFTPDAAGKLTLEKPTTAVCTPASDEFCTSAGNSRLDAFIASKSGYGPGSPNYYLTFGNTTSETVGDLSFVDTFVGKLTIN